MARHRGNASLKGWRAKSHVILSVRQLWTGCRPQVHRIAVHFVIATNPIVFGAYNADGVRLESLNLL